MYNVVTFGTRRIDMQTKKITAYLTCEKFVDDLYEEIQQRYKASLHKDAIVINLSNEQNIILFRFGVFVCWNVSFENIKFFFEFIKSYEINSFDEKIIEEASYNFADEFKIQLDNLTLNNDSILAKIAISHAFAQDVKLEQFEKAVQNSIEQNSNIPLELSKKGKIALTKKEISNKVGELFLVKSAINLHYDLLDTPEFIWEYPEFEEYYEKTIKYLDIKPRVKVLNKRVEVIQELLNMLANEQNHKYSSFLEWIIIILITFEIVMNLVDHFK